MNRQLLSEKTGTFDRLRMSSYLTFCNVVKEATLRKENIAPVFHCLIGQDEQRPKLSSPGQQDYKDLSQRPLVIKRSLGKIKV